MVLGSAILAAAVVLPGAAIGISEGGEHRADKPVAPNAAAPKTKASPSAPGSSASCTPSGVPFGAGVAPLTKSKSEPAYYALISVEDVLSRIQKKHVEWGGKQSVLRACIEVMPGAVKPSVCRHESNSNCWKTDHRGMG